jgi:hypothetical protein
MPVVCQPPIFKMKKTECVEYSVFLAGTIEMGASEDWQSKAIEILKDHCAIIYNPRRDDWDSSWTQEIDDPNFNVQVNWELEHIERADLVLMYLDPTSKSPISLLELGLLAAMDPKKVWVCCPEGFYRKGNVDIVCNRYGIKQYATLSVMLTAAREHCKASTEMNRDQ